MFGAEHGRECAAANACHDPACAGWFRDLHRGHHENAAWLGGHDQQVEREGVRNGLHRGGSPLSRTRRTRSFSKSPRRGTILSMR